MFSRSISRTVSSSLVRTTNWSMISWSDWKTPGLNFRMVRLRGLGHGVSLSRKPIARFSANGL